MIYHIECPRCHLPQEKQTSKNFTWITCKMCGIYIVHNKAERIITVQDIIL